MKKVVIIGGGFTGAYCAKELQNSFNVTLIDTKNYFEFTPSILRTLVSPKHSNKIQVEHNDYLKKAKFIKDKVIEVTEDFVRTNSKKHKFDYLIIASGSTYNSPIKESGLVITTRSKHLREAYDKLVKSKEILIIGGGLVGVELAGEICTYYPDKNITLVHSHNNLIDRNTKKAQKYAEKFLKKHKVKIIFNEHVNKKISKDTFITDSGTNIKTDLPFLCVGIKSNYEFMIKNFKDLLNNKNQLIVNKHLQLKDNKNIFTGGDITGIIEEKTAHTAESHAKLIIKNIHNLENKKPLLTHNPKKTAMLISLGKYTAILDSPSLTLTGFIPAFIKWCVEVKTMRHYR
jgi:apoptosis-inducing factor 2